LIKVLKTGLRLQQIQKMLSKRYDHIWDCCCDHGLLGFNLLNTQMAQHVHFVDIVPELLAEIRHTLEKHWQGPQHAWHVHCIDVAQLPIKDFSIAEQADSHLIIIAGIGGELLIELLHALLPLCADYHLEFILCPVHHNYKLRQFLIAHDFGLIDERLVFENKRGYEILHVSHDITRPLSRVGGKMWDLSDLQHARHLQKTLGHYQRIATNPHSDVSDIINHYQQLR